jgi:hypothetical protein
MKKKGQLPAWTRVCPVHSGDLLKQHKKKQLQKID